MLGYNGTERIINWLDSSRGGRYDVWAVVEWTAQRLSFPPESCHHMSNDALTEICNALGVMSDLPRENIRDFIVTFSEEFYDNGERC